MVKKIPRYKDNRRALRRIQTFIGEEVHRKIKALAAKHGVRLCDITEYSFIQTLKEFEPRGD